MNLLSLPPQIETLTNVQKLVYLSFQLFDLLFHVYIVHLRIEAKGGDQKEFMNAHQIIIIHQNEVMKLRVIDILVNK